METEISREFLDPARKLVDEVADWLFARVRTTPEGAKSLGHLMVMVPTAQSGRNLRLALAKKAAAEFGGGILPPRIEMASSLLVPEGVRIATGAEELAAMAEALGDTGAGIDWTLDRAGVILDIDRILGEAAMLVSEVDPPHDKDRWDELKGIEGRFITLLESKGALPGCVARRKAAKEGCRDAAIEEIVLPSAVDLQKAFVDYLENSAAKKSILIHAEESESEKFDEWGRPKAIFASPIDPESIEASPTAVQEADEIAKTFRGVKADEAYPALVVGDSEMYPELEGAFQNHFSGDELVLRNPSKEKLATSPLGRLLGAMVRLGEDGDYETFSTFVRTGDVARWAAGALGVGAEEVARFTGALDMVQNQSLPRTIEEAIAGAARLSESAWREDEREDAAGLKRLAEAVKAEIADPFAFLRKIFASLTLDEKNPGDRELIAAAEAVRDLREACASDLVPDRYRKKIFARLLKSAAYMLEPTAENVLATTGWLEVPWCAEDEMVIAGFNEGCVPENVVGHPFLPDSLRKELGVTTNEKREARDSFILAQALRCRKKGAVSVRLHQIAGDKSVVKPSRLIFPGVGDEQLPGLAMRLYAVTKGGEGAPPKELPPAWKLKLPIPPKGTLFREKISPTALDRYLRCPFNFYLQEVFGEHVDDRNQELDAMAFGTLCHEALDMFAKNGPKDSTDADEIAAYLAGEVKRQLSAFGINLPAVVELQGEAAIERLKAFSVHQAARRKAGWRILSSEQNLKCRIKGCPTVLSGKVDRIDRHEATGELAIIDYKTWNKAKEENYASLQLPIYRAMVESSKLYDSAKAHEAKALYCILAERAEDSGFDESHVFHAGNQSEAEDAVVALLTNLAKGIFYPPRKAPGAGSFAWQQNYSSLVWETPESGICAEWLEDQKARLEADK